MRILLFISVFTFPCLSFSDDIQYPINQKDRGLILPKGVGEISIGPAWLNGNERKDFEAYWSFRYALTENLEIARMGLRYRFLNINDSQFSISLQNYGLGNSESQGSFHHTAVETDAKQHINDKMALLYSVGYFWSDSHEKDGETNESRVKFGGIYKLSEISALNINYTYRDISGFNTRSANLLKAMLTINMVKKWDLVIEYGHSSFNEAVDSVLFNESYDDVFSIRANWRIQSNK